MLLSALAVASLQAKTISLNVEVGRAEYAVAALAKASGERLSVTEPLASEVVFLKVDKLTLAEVMTSLANVTWGTWDKGEKGYVLSRDPKWKEREKAQDAEQSEKQLDLWHRQLIKALDTPFDAATQGKLVHEFADLEVSFYRQRSMSLWRFQEECERYWSYDPISRVLARCIRNMSMKTIANMDPQERIVFDTQPREGEQPLPVEAKNSLNMLVSEQELWGPILATLNKRSGFNDYFYYDHVPVATGTWGALNPT